GGDDKGIFEMQLRTTGGLASVALDVDDSTGEASVTLDASGTDGNGRVIIEDSATQYRVQINGFPLRLAQRTTDPTLNLQDGMLWYRTDHDKIRARINGTTVNLAVET